MIYWAPFLHFYQPPIQFHAILKKICDESYRPLLNMFKEHPSSKITINICGVLTEMLGEHGADDILKNIKELAHNKQLEFVESAKYHPVLPLLPAKEMKRQIKLNRKTNENFFKSSYKPCGFFPPEMCYSSEVAAVVKAMGYEWILAGGIACQDTWPLDFIPAISCGSSSIIIFYRDDVLSNKVSFHSLDSAGFIKELVNLSKDKKDIYVITAMDAETFGHHIRHWEELFLAKVYETINNIEKTRSHNHPSAEKKRSITQAHKEIFAEVHNSLHIKVVTISELAKKFPLKNSKSPGPSSWSTSKEDIALKNYYPLWKDIDNQIHELQWDHLHICFELTDQAMALRNKYTESYNFAVLARGLLDKASHSCQFWWANKKHGTWNINLINKGLLLQEETIFNAYKAINVSSIDLKIKKNLYHKVTAARHIANKIRDLLMV